MLSRTLPNWFRSLFDPLSIAAYVAWAVVWLTTLAAVGEHRPQHLPYAQWAMLLFLAGFVLSTRNERPIIGWRLALILCLMAACGLFMISLQPNGTANILLVLLVAVLAAHLSLRSLLMALLGLNLAVLTLMRMTSTQSWQQVLLSMLAFASFQAFAALVMRNARRAEQMAETLQATNAELLTTRLLLAESVRDQERLRLSRELHDVAGHGLTALKLNLGVLTRDPAQNDRERVQLCAQLADDLLQNLRAVVQQLRADRGLDLRSVLQRIALPFPRPGLQLELSEPLPELSFAQVEALMRAVQESMTNAARHSSATRLIVAIRAETAQLRLEISDDGRAPPQINWGGGLSGMRERFEELGGSVNLSTGANGGLCLNGEFPLSPISAAAT